MREPRKRGMAVSIASSLMILSLGLVPTINAADHLDGPGVANNGAADITDIYAFSTANHEKTVLVLNVNPGAGALAQSGTTFGTGVQYMLKVDTNGDFKPDVTYMVKFGSPSHGVQSMKLYRNGNLVSDGWTGQDNAIKGGGKITAGLFDDPFFFDLDAFKGAVLMSGNGRSFCDSGTTDFFLGLNVSSIIIKVPNSKVGGQNANIGIWATTNVLRKGAWVQADQMGRPAINTVFNNVDSAHKTDREAFNSTQPVKQPDLFGQHVQDVLTALGAADPAGLAGVLLPDVLTYQTGNTDGFLNGRRLADDVIDAELNLVTNGGITTDCVDNDSMLSSHWPYLAAANN